MKYIFIISVLIVLSIILFIFLIQESFESKKWENIDKIIYINLDDRTDRRKEIETELQNAGVPSSKIIRLNAIRDSPGHIGCSKSHIEALKMAIREGWRNVLILEDDAMWNNFEEGYQRLQKLMTDYPNYDVITFGNVQAEFDKNTSKLYSAQTTTAYLVNRPYYETLLRNFEEGLSQLLITKTISDPSERTKYENKYCIDQYWKNLQPIHNWYIVNPALMIQRPSNSSILGGHVDYTSVFNL